jgi:hypothetical protein
MERIKKIDKEENPVIPIIPEVNPDEGKVRFKKVGGGSLRLKNRIIKSGQVFTAFPSDIPKSFRDVVIVVGGTIDGKTVNWKDEPVKDKEPVIPPEQITKPEYTIQLRGKSNTWYDVVDGKGKVLNEKGLTKEVAEKFVENLLK